jgi:hypothetical protein
MRLAFCFMSNNMENILKLYDNFHYSITPPYVIDSYTVNMLTNPPVHRYFHPCVWNFKWKKYNTTMATDYFSMRQDSLKMADDADVIFVGDDDFVFNIGSSEVINECCLYLKRNVDCGAILLGANFGEEGAKHGDEIYITNNGHLNTNRGIIVRNRMNLMDNRFHALGAMEDSVISFTFLINGYYIARRLHVPIDHIVERNTLKVEHNNINYDINYLKQYGIWARVIAELDEWNEQSIWPKGIWRMYHHMAMVRGFTPRYTTDGEIILQGG